MVENSSGMTSNKIPCLIGFIIMCRFSRRHYFFYFSLFIASAACRTFRAHKGINRVAHCGYPCYAGKGAYRKYISQYIPTIADWIMAVPNPDRKRGMQKVSALGAIATSLKDYIWY